MSYLNSVTDTQTYKTGISIIIPFYNGEEHICKLLSAIIIAYNKLQTPLSTEVIIVIDSVDTAVQSIETLIAPTINACPDISFIVYKNKVNIGVAKSRNEGLKIACYEYILFIDQDDEVSSSFFFSIQPYLGEKDLILSNGLIIDTTKNIDFKLYYLAPEISLKKIIIKSFIRSPGQVLLHRGILPAHGFITARKNLGADDKFLWIDIMLNYQGKLRVAYISECLYQAYLHGNNVSNNFQQLASSNLELWELIASKTQLHGKERRWAEIDKRIQRLVLGQTTSGFDKLRCISAYALHKFDLNSLIRFTIKKTKALFK